MLRPFALKKEKGKKMKKIGIRQGAGQRSAFLTVP